MSSTLSTPRVSFGGGSNEAAASDGGASPPNTPPNEDEVASHEAAPSRHQPRSLETKIASAFGAQPGSVPSTPTAQARPANERRPSVLRPEAAERKKSVTDSLVKTKTAVAGPAGGRGGLAEQKAVKPEGRSSTKPRIEAHRRLAADRLRNDAKAKSRKDGVLDGEGGEAEDAALEKLHGELLEALKSGDGSALRSFLAANPDSLDAKFGPFQGTPLHLALRHSPSGSLLSSLEAILSFEPDVDAPDKGGRTPLMSASGRGLLEAAQLLLDHHASINAQDDTKSTALHDAVGNSHADVVKLLLQHEANPNMGNEVGRTPLHWAASRGHHGVLGLLLLVDYIDVSPKDIRHGYTPLHDACHWRLEAVVSTLLENGADANARSSKSWTPLHVAAHKGNAAVVEALLKAGADTMVYTQALDTPESLAQKRKWQDIVELLKRKDMTVNAAASKTGKDLNVSKPSPGQEEMCRQVEGFIWPSVEETYWYDALTVWDLLYSEDPKVKKIRGSRKPRWIHLPANNRVWVEDVFKLIYSSDSNKMKQQGKRVFPETPTKLNAETTLRNIMEFVDNQFGEMGRVETTCYRQPHYKCAIGPQPRSRDFYNHMVSAVLPVIDVDMQQPYYYLAEEDERTMNEVTSEPEHETPEAKEKRLVRKYTASEGRELTNQEEHHVQRMWELGRVYDIHRARSLDESFHELLAAEDVNHRNGDQVVSRFLGRYRLEVDPDDEDRDEVAEEASTHETLAGYINRNEKAGNTTEPHSRSPGEETQPELTQSKVLSLGSRLNDVGTDTIEKRPNTSANAPTPSQLENQEPRERPRAATWVSKLVSTITKPKDPGEIRTAPVTAESEKASSVVDSDASSDSFDPHVDDEEGMPENRPRQQLLVVPQLWIWRVENTIVTAFPDRWDSSNTRVLPKLMLASVEERSKTAKRDQRFEDMDVHSILHGILESCLDFEPLFSAYEEERSYHDAFAAEIGYVSSQVAACYDKYRDSLGKAEESFATAMKDETDLLVTVDDILSEIAMIKRAQQDQEHVCLALKAEHDRINTPRKRDPWAPSPASGGGGLFGNYHHHSPSRPGTLSHSQSGPPGSMLHNGRAGDHSSRAGDLLFRATPPAGGGGGGDLFRSGGLLERSPAQEGGLVAGAVAPRPVLARRVDARLRRQEEDAKRFRESIITLLDLRQRQASTENAINSGKQAHILFGQSKVLFVFTGATVIFAPLSWISSLLALKVDGFTPDTWEQVQVFGASFGSLLGTLLLCFTFLRLYDHAYQGRDDAGSEATRGRKARNWDSLVGWSGRGRGLLRRRTSPSSGLQVSEVASTKGRA